MRIALLAYATDTGLGHQTQEFYKHMKPAKTLIADLSDFNGMPLFLDRFDGRFDGTDEGIAAVKGIPNCDAMDWLSTDVDIIFVCETPLNYCLFEKAKRKGVPVVLQYNYEFLDYLQRTDIEAPAVLAAPSSWNRDKVEAMNIAPVVDWPVPANTDDIKPRVIEKAQTFVHIAGKEAAHDRNGTFTFLEAAIKTGKRYKYRVYAQNASERLTKRITAISRDIDIELVENTPNYADIYKSGDVLVMPRKYGGLCLPMQEALAAGMPVVMSDVSPNDQRLPKQWLVKATKKSSFMARTEIDIYETDVDHLAYKMAQLATDDEFMQWSNKEALRLGKELSWETLKSYYESMLQTVIHQQ